MLQVALKVRLKLCRRWVKKNANLGVQQRRTGSDCSYWNLL